VAEMRSWYCRESEPQVVTVMRLVLLLMSVPDAILDVGADMDPEESGRDT